VPFSGIISRLSTRFLYFYFPNLHKFNFSPAVISTERLSNSRAGSVYSFAWASHQYRARSRSVVFQSHSPEDARSVPIYHSDCVSQCCFLRKMPLSTDVGLGPDDIVLAPPRKTAQHPHFSARVYCRQTVAPISAVTGQLADTPTHGLDIWRTGQLADDTGDSACLVFVLLAASARPRVV